MWNLSTPGATSKGRQEEKTMTNCCDIEKNHDKVLITDLDLIHVICITCGKEWVE